MGACSSTNTSLLQTKSNLACSQAAAEMCPRQMVRLASHGGSRNASQHPQSKKVQRRVFLKLLKVIQNMQLKINHVTLLTVAGEGALWAVSKSCVTGLSVGSIKYLTAVSSRKTKHLH